VENILGTWCLASHDVDRSVATIAFKTFKETVVTIPKNADDSPTLSNFLLLDDSTRSALTSFIQRTTLDPGGVYLYLNPIAPLALPPVFRPHQSKKGSAKGSYVSTPTGDDGGDQTPRTKVDEQEESEQDRKARLRIGAFGAAKWILGIGPWCFCNVAMLTHSLIEITPTLSEDLLAFYSNPVIWSALSPLEICPWIGIESFGYAQPNLRKSAWTLLQTLLTSHLSKFFTPTMP